MDAALTLTRLSEDLSSLLEDQDFEGAEELLSASLSANPKWSAFIHYHLGRLYYRWNKLTSATHHLHHAIDASEGNEMFMVQVLEELSMVKRVQLGQRP